MENITDITSMVVSDVRSVGHDRPSKFTKAERAPIAYFFMRLSDIYGVEYKRQLPDMEAEIRAKREWGDSLKHYDREQLDKGIEFIKKQLINSDDNWQFLNIGRCVGAIREATRSREAHKALPTPEGKRMDKVEALGLFASMRENLDIKPAPPKRIDTTANEAELTRVER